MMSNPLDKDNDHQIYQVLWEEPKPKVYVSTQGSYADSPKEVPLATHQIDISQSGLNRFTVTPKVEALQVNSSILGEETELDAQLIAEEHLDEQIITEISSSECITEKKRKRKLSRGKKDDHHYGCHDSIPVNTFDGKITKFKKEKDKDGEAASSIRKKFSRNWYQIPEFSKWLEESPIPGYAFCNVCRKDLLPGKSELLKHSLTAKHKRKIEAIGHGTKDDPLNHRIVDLRSDTVTIPNRDMRDAMKNALVGDCAFGEDPTVQELEEKVAKLLSKEAGLFVPTGTMANLICVLTHCWSRGSLVILGDQSYMYRASQGSIAEIANVSQRSVRNLPDGTFEISDLKDILRTHGPNWPSMTLVCVENTHSMMGGKAVSAEWMETLGTLCAEYGIPIHLDGARLINASAALGTSPARLAQYCSSATFCLNKGLGSPAGCVITGNQAFIERATVVRKSLGGTIHQAGILAAACLYGLNNFVSRIAKDHNNAIAIAKAVCGVNSTAVTVDVSNVQTNIVHLICDNIRVNPEQFCARMNRVIETEALELLEGVEVKCTPIQPNIVRIMTHGDLLMEDVRAVIRKLQYVIQEYDSYFVIEYNVSESC